LRWKKELCGVFERNKTRGFLCLNEVDRLHILRNIEAFGPKLLKSFFSLLASSRASAVFLILITGFEARRYFTSLSFQGDRTQCSFLRRHYQGDISSP
jgi:hypothetical protein